MQLFRTNRLIVRQFKVTEEEAFFRFNSHPDVMRFIRPVQNRAASATFFVENLAIYSPGELLGRWFVEEQDTGLFAGVFSFLPVQGTTDIHIGYALMPPFQGRGLATELVRYGMDYFFTHTEKEILYAITDPQNLVSHKVLFKSGFRQLPPKAVNGKETIQFACSREEYRSATAAGRA